MNDDFTLITALDAAPVLGCEGCDECGPVPSVDDFPTAEEALHEAWAGSPEQRRAEAEALRMFPDALHLGKFDGLMSDAEIDRRMLIQRQAYELGEKQAWIRAQQEPTEEHLDAALLAFLTAENLAVIPDISRERADEYAREEMKHGVERVREALRAALSAARAARRDEEKR